MVVVGGVLLASERRGIADGPERGPAPEGGRRLAARALPPAPARMPAAAAPASREAPHATPMATALATAYARHADAVAPHPRIAHKDTMAEALAGEVGRRVMEEMAGALAGGDVAAMAVGIADRTVLLDDVWMDALGKGVRQFVLVASGMDARAWRLPCQSFDARVFEVDVEEVHAHKNARLAEMRDPPSTSGTRYRVHADLNDGPAWASRIVDAGLDSSLPALFVLEGCLMYLELPRVEALLAEVRGLCCGGSVLAGDCFVDTLDKLAAAGATTVVAQLGAPWRSEFANGAHLRSALTEAGFQVRTVFHTEAARRHECDLKGGVSFVCTVA